MKTQEKEVILKILVLVILCFFTQSTKLEAETISLESGYESAIAWSPDSLEIAIGTQKGIFIIKASNAEIAKSFGREQLIGSGFITDIDWSPDGKRLVFSYKEEITIHYPSDIGIISRDGETAKKITNSTLYSIIAEDSKSTTVRSVHYRTPKWTPDGCCILLTVETIDRTDYEESTQSDEQITLVVTRLDPETGNMETLSTGCCPEWSKDRHKLLIGPDYNTPPSYAIDYDEGSHKLLPDTKTHVSQYQQQSLLDSANVNSKKIPGLSLYDQYLSPDGKKLIIKMSKPDGRYEFILKDAYVQ
jgi:dipeptidyl aminopeptidase/acylaminoacyl peptidase